MAERLSPTPTWEPQKLEINVAQSPHFDSRALALTIPPDRWLWWHQFPFGGHQCPGRPALA